MKNYVHEGFTLTAIAPYNVSAGGGVLVSGTSHYFGIAVNTQLSGDNMEIVVVGVFDLVKDTSTFAEGDYVYWDNTAKKATSTSTSNTKIGVANMIRPDGTSAPGAGSGDATVRVRLQPNLA